MIVKTTITLFLFCMIVNAGILDSVSIDSAKVSRIKTSINDVPGFGLDGSITYYGWQYLAYYNIDKSLCVARRRLPEASWDTLVVGHFTAEIADGHNYASIGLSPIDGTIHVAFDCHGGPLRYTVSVKGLALEPDSFAWTGQLFGPVMRMTNLNATYPTFFLRPDSVLQFAIRDHVSGDGDWYLYEYDTAGSQWNGLGMFLSRTGSFEWPPYGVSDSRSAYPNGFTYEGNRLHMTWCWREGAYTNSFISNHDLMYAYSDDFGRTWRNNTGDSIGSTGSNPIKLTSPGITMWTIPVNRGYINQCAQGVDNEGGVHVVTWHVRDGDPDNGSPYPANGWYFHYYREPNGTWRRDSMFTITDRPHNLYFDDNNNAFLVIGTTVYAATAGTRWTDWTMIVNTNENGLSEGLADFYQWKTSRVLSLISGYMTGNITMMDYAVSDVRWPFVKAEVLSSRDSSAIVSAFGGWFKGRDFIRGGKTDSSGNLLIRLDTGSYDMSFRVAGYSRNILSGFSVHGSVTDTLHARLYLDPLTPTRLRISPDTLQLNTKDSASLECRIEYADGSKSDGTESYVWSSLSPDIVQINADGWVYALEKTGDALIVCSSVSTGLTDTLRIRVMLLKTVSLQPTADSYVQNAEFSDTNYGSSTSLIVWTTQWSYNRRTYIQFNTAGLVGKTISSATLKLNLLASNINSVLNLPIYNVTTPWAENTITWNNSPAQSTAIDTAAVYPTGWASWDLSSWMGAHPQDTILNLCVMEPVNNDFNANFASREHSDTTRRPRLFVTYSDTGAGSTGLSTAGTNGPELGFTILSNPFNPACHMRASLPQASELFLDVFDLAGRHIRRIAWGTYPEGVHGFIWNGDNDASITVASGVYVLKLAVGGKTYFRRAVFLK